VRWVTYRSGRDGRDHAGLVLADRVHGHRDDEGLLPLLGDLEGVAAELRSEPWEVIALGEAELRAPIPVPPSIRDFMSFESHVVTSMEATGFSVDPTWYEQPVFYFSNPAAVHGPRDDVAVAPGSGEFDFELEVAAVIGRECSNVSVREAERYVAGFTILCDWSARDLQVREMRQSLGPAKGKDSATSLGPYLVTPDELADRRAGKGFDLQMSAFVNGQPYSSGNWRDIHWSFGQMISYASRGTRLVPGDLIGSGTVGSGCILELSRVHGLERFPWLRPGDRVRLSVELLGQVEAVVTPASAFPPHSLL
jgi:2-keto-4-pentenoate hydratase/2-oxohepta-3-ene-1,7-dioic acid hydratase in catechol pathway